MDASERGRNARCFVKGGASFENIHGAGMTGPTVDVLLIYRTGNLKHNYELILIYIPNGKYPCHTEMNPA